MKGSLDVFKSGKVWLIRALVAGIVMIGALSVADYLFSPYKQCMRAEKRANAYFGQYDYLPASTNICARQVHLSRPYFQLFSM